MNRFIDLFSGIGGIRIAFQNTGAKCVFSSEINKHAQQTYFENFNEFPSGDITKIEAKDIPEFDILAAGFPCQPFSIAGQRKGFEDARGTLFFEVARIVKFHKPKAFLLENVSGLVSHDDGNTMSIILKTVDELGYTAEWKLINSKDYGIPQNRNRWYCVAFKKSLAVEFNKSNIEFSENKFNFFNTSNSIVKLSDIIQKSTSPEYMVSETAIKNINTYMPQFISSHRYNPNNVLLAYDVRPSRCRFRNDGISPCLTAKMGTGGNNIPIVVKQNRRLTEDECLRIMGFPENFKIKKNTMQSYKQIGNSVVIPVIETIATEIIRILNKSKTLV